MDSATVTKQRRTQASYMVTNSVATRSAIRLDPTATRKQARRATFPTDWKIVISDPISSHRNIPSQFAFCILHFSIFTSHFSLAWFVKNPECAAHGLINICPESFTWNVQKHEALGAGLMVVPVLLFFSKCLQVKVLREDHATRSGIPKRLVRIVPFLWIAR